MNRIEARKAAEQAALQSYLNCYIRETGMGRFTEDAPSELANVHSGKWLHLPLKKRQEDLYIPAVYVSETGRHLFHAVYYQSEKMDFPAFAEKNAG